MHNNMANIISTSCNGCTRSAVAMAEPKCHSMMLWCSACPWTICIVYTLLVHCCFTSSSLPCLALCTELSLHCFLLLPALLCTAPLLLCTDSSPAMSAPVSTITSSQHYHQNCSRVSCHPSSTSHKDILQWESLPVGFLSNPGPI